MPVNVTETAAREIDAIIRQQGLDADKVRLRVGVKGGGCSGFSYDLNFDSDVSEKDRVTDFFGVRLAIEKKFDPYLDGTEIDFVTNDLGQRGFKFNNPNVVKSCGCGSSFQV